MLHIATIESSTLALLRSLMSLEVLQGTRLVGGTALALQLGHRKSIDLEFFGSIDTELFEVGNPFGPVHSVERIRNTKNIKIYLIDGIKVDIVNYQYPWMEDALGEGGLRLASLKDISAMKLSAVTGRGTKKDFIDLSFLLEKYSLKQMLIHYLEKYHDGSEFLVLKSLGYFLDAEEDEMPEMIIKKSWDQAKSEIDFALTNYVTET